MKHIIYHEEDNDNDNNDKHKNIINENFNELKLLRQGTVTEITLGDKVFQVTDPQRIEHAIKILEQHEESMYKIRQLVKAQNVVINNLVEEINQLKSDIIFLRDNYNGYGSREMY